MNWLDQRLERDTNHIADRATPSPTAWDAIQTRIAEQADQPEMEIIMLDKAPPPPRRTGLWVMSAAAALLLIVGGIALATRSDKDPSAVFVGEPDTPAETIDTEPDTPAETIDTEPEPAGTMDTEPEPAEPQPEIAGEAEAVAIAEQFIAARHAYDGAAVRALVADDASIVLHFEWISSPDDYLLLADYERAHGIRFLDASCDAGSPGRVRCGYTLESDVTVALGVGPYQASFLLEISDGLIRQLNHNRTTNEGVPGEYYTDVLGVLGFGQWLGVNHPDDSDNMYDPGGGNNVAPPFITPESVALWEERLPEFIASLDG